MPYHQFQNVHTKTGWCENWWIFIGCWCKTECISFKNYDLQFVL